MIFSLPCIAQVVDLNPCLAKSKSDPTIYIQEKIAQNLTLNLILHVSNSKTVIWITLFIRLKDGVCPSLEPLQITKSYEMLLQYEFYLS